MSLDLWLAFVMATAIMVAIPGPTVMLVVSYALSHGRRSGWSTVPGVALGDITCMTLSFVGLGAVLSASAIVFEIVKWAGAAYLVYLGVQLWRAPPVIREDGVLLVSASRRKMLGHAWAVTSLNPKGIVFFVAFVPQFLVPTLPVVQQLLVLGMTFSVIATLNSIAYVLLAGTVRMAVRGPKLRRRVNRVGGTLLIGAGLVTAGLRRVS